MATSLEQLRAFAGQLGFECSGVDFSGNKYLAINVPTRMPSGDTQALTVFVRTYDDGELFEAMIREFLPTELHQQSDHKLPFLFYLLHKAWETKFGTPEVDKDGEVRLLVEFPLVDAEMTVRQFERIVKILCLQAVEIAIEGAKVLKTGEVPSSKQEDSSTSVQDMIDAVLPGMLQLATTEAGRAKLLAAANNEDAPELVRDLAKKILAEMSSASPDAV